MCESMPADGRGLEMWCWRQRGFEQKLLGELQNQQQRSLFCDTLLQAEGISVPAHSCVLAALSPALAQVLSSGPAPKPGQSRLLKLQAVGAQALLKLVGFLYSGQLQGESSAQREQLLQAAAHLGIHGLLEEGRGDGRRGEREGARQWEDEFEQMRDSEQEIQEVKEEVWSLAEGCRGREKQWERLKEAEEELSRGAREAGNSRMLQTDCADAVRPDAGTVFHNSSSDPPRPPSTISPSPCPTLPSEAQPKPCQPPLPTSPPGGSSDSSTISSSSPPDTAHVSRTDGVAAPVVTTAILNTATVQPSISSVALHGDVTTEPHNSTGLGAAPSTGCLTPPAILAPSKKHTFVDSPREGLASCTAEMPPPAVPKAVEGKSMGQSHLPPNPTSTEQDRGTAKEEDEPVRMRSSRVRRRVQRGGGGVAIRSIPRVQQRERQITIKIRLQRLSHGELWEIVSVREEGGASAPRGRFSRGWGRGPRHQQSQPAYSRIGLNKDGFPAVNRQRTHPTLFPRRIFRAPTLTSPSSLPSPSPSIAPQSSDSALSLSPPQRPHPPLFPAPTPGSPPPALPTPQSSYSALSLSPPQRPHPPLSPGPAPDPPPPALPTPDDSDEQIEKLLDDIMMGLNILPPIVMETEGDGHSSERAAPLWGQSAVLGTSVSGLCPCCCPHSDTSLSLNSRVATGDASCSRSAAGMATADEPSSLVETGFLSPRTQDEGSCGSGPDSESTECHQCTSCPLDLVFGKSWCSCSQETTHPPNSVTELHIQDHFLQSSKSQPDCVQGHRDAGGIVIPGAAANPRAKSGELGFESASGTVAPEPHGNGQACTTSFGQINITTVANTVLQSSSSVIVPKSRSSEVSPVPVQKQKPSCPAASPWRELRIPEFLSPLGTDGGQRENLAAEPLPLPASPPLQLPPWLSPFPLPLDLLASPATSSDCTPLSLQALSCPSPAKRSLGICGGKKEVGRSKILTRGRAREERRKRKQREEEEKDENKEQESGEVNNLKKVKWSSGSRRASAQEHGRTRRLDGRFEGNMAKGSMCTVRHLSINVCTNKTLGAAGCEQNILQAVRCTEKSKKPSVCIRNLKKSVICTPNVKRTAVCAENLKRTGVCVENLKRTAVCTEKHNRTAVCAENQNRTAVCAESHKRMAICAEKLKRTAVCAEKPPILNPLAWSEKADRLMKQEQFSPPSIIRAMSSTGVPVELQRCTIQPVSPKRATGRLPKKRQRPKQRIQRECREEEPGIELSILDPNDSKGLIGRQGNESPMKRRKQDSLELAEVRHAGKKNAPGLVTVATPPSEEECSLGGDGPRTPRTRARTRVTSATLLQGHVHREREGWKRRRSGVEEKEFRDYRPAKREADQMQEVYEENGGIGGAGEGVETEKGTDGVVELGKGREIEPEDFDLRQSDAGGNVDQEANVGSSTWEGMLRHVHPGPGKETTVKGGEKTVTDREQSNGAGGTANGQIIELCIVGSEHLQEPLLITVRETEPITSTGGRNEENEGNTPTMTNMGGGNEENEGNTPMLKEKDEITHVMEGQQCEKDDGFYPTAEDRKIVPTVEGREKEKDESILTIEGGNGQKEDKIMPMMQGRNQEKEQGTGSTFEGGELLKGLINEDEARESEDDHDVITESEATENEDEEVHAMEEVEQRESEGCGVKGDLERDPSHVNFNLQTHTDLATHLERASIEMAKEETQECATEREREMEGGRKSGPAKRQMSIRGVTNKQARVIWKRGLTEQGAGEGLRVEEAGSSLRATDLMEGMQWTEEAEQDLELTQPSGNSQAEEPSCAGLQGYPDIAGVAVGLLSDMSTKGFPKKTDMTDKLTLHSTPTSSPLRVMEQSPQSCEQEEQEEEEVVDVLECSSPAPLPSHLVVEAVGAGLGNKGVEISDRELSEQADDEEGEIDVIGDETD